MGAKAERALSAMVTASRLGAGPAHLKTIARAAGVTSKIASELIGTLAPRVAAEKVVNP
jgi:DNA-binding IscR family transcriptional regulator